MEFLTYRHVVNLGDLISALPGIRHLYKTTGKKAIIYQQLNRPGEYYAGADHPTKNEAGAMVCMNQEMFDMLKPLLLAQEYIEDFRVYAGEKVDYDLDVVRQQVYCGAPHFPLHKWTWMAYPEMACDLSKQWFFLRAKKETENFRIEWGDKKYIPVDGFDDYALVNFTERYRNFNINYFFLKKYESRLIFAGTKKEHELFCNQWGLNLPLLIVGDFLELAQAIMSCNFFIGNQSFCWHISQAMGIPRILELYPFAQNCTNFGEMGFEFYHQPQLEYYVDKLFNE